MKKIKAFFSNIAVGLLTALVIAVLLPALLWKLLCTPIDMIRYYKMPYYRDRKEKYGLFKTGTTAVKLYNRVATKNLPWRFVKNEHIEYFVRDGQVLLLGWSSPDCGYDGEWYIELYDDDETPNRMALEELIEEDRPFLLEEDRDKPVKLLLFRDDYEDEEVLHQAERCPYYFFIDSINDPI